MLFSKSLCSVCVIVLILLTDSFTFANDISPKSITEFHDDFESGESKWTLKYFWGIDPQYKYSGSYSLSESPYVNYYPGSDTAPEGGAPAEITDAFDFSSVPDVEMSFWLRYEIEPNFDFLHLQSCTDGINWFTLKSWSSDTEGLIWYQENIPLGCLAGFSDVHIRFLFCSDGAVEMSGSNIDDIDIVPNYNDVTPPYIYYTKLEDYYDNNPDGFEIQTQITDFSGINYANVLYKVDGGTEISLPPSSVNGDVYSFTIPAQYAGSYVEFRFDCEDMSANSNQSYIGPFFYRAGLHQIYDTEDIVRLVEVMNNPDVGEYKEISVRHTVFRDDIVGAVIRGYFNGGTVNGTMLIQVYTDDNGLPGTPLLPAPVPFTNPATFSDPEGWGYLDLSSYPQLKNLEGEYHLGIACDSDGSYGSTATLLSYNLGSDRSCNKYIPSEGSEPVWEITNDYVYYIRAVTTNNDLIPPTISPDPTEVTVLLPSDFISNAILAINNPGEATLNFTGIFEYDGYFKTDSTFYDENFDSDLDWIPTGELAWYMDNGTSSLDGTPFSRIDALTSGGSTTKYGILTSGYINTSGYENLKLDFDYYRSLSTGSYEIEISTDGINWNYLWGGTGAAGAWDSPYHRSVNIPEQYCVPELQIRLNVGLPKNGGLFAIDNITLKGTVPYSWLTLDGSNTISGSIPVSGSDNFTVGFDTSGLTQGDYTASIYLNSIYSNVIVPVTLSVGAQQDIPSVPSNITFTISGSDLTIDWDISPSATSYDVYSSDDPYGTFSLEQNVTINQITLPAVMSKKFYYIIAKN
ncbi:MAG: hypothetical protein PHF33_00890 [Candidatus Delongbacteria bacterium]|nr:hypothetical protein [Candidatus Delongbacteria bacterium]MDD4204465.1 hypothetical protein [Candidatus Delongbacteria bacterium]